MAVAALAAPAAALASPVTIDGPRAISGETPFPRGCAVTGTDAQPGGEGEPSIAVDPRDPRRLLATYQQDRFIVFGGARTDPMAVSGDGGRTWDQVLVPGMSACTGGRDERASDPWVSFGPDGRAYAAWLGFDFVPVVAQADLAGPTHVLASSSTDGGRTWSRPTDVIRDQTYNDREAITADPGRPGHAYVAWVKRYGLLGESGIEFVSRTTDGGRTWSSPRLVYAPPPGFLTDPTLITVLPDGTLLNSFLLGNGTAVLPAVPRIPWRVMTQRSTDGGRTWSRAVEVGAIKVPAQPTDPDSGSSVRAYNVISSDVAPDGTAYVAWNDILSTTSSRIYVARSRDGGRSWSSPLTAAQVGSQAFLPALAAGDDGAVAVIWDDFRRDRHGDHALTTDVWVAHSHDRGTSWREDHLAGPFDVLTGPKTSTTEISGHFLGDYQALQRLGGQSFGGVFAQARPAARAGPSDIFFARVTLGARALRGQRLRLAVSPRRVRAGRRTLFRFRVTVGRRRPRGVRGALVRFAGKRVRTRRGGRAAMAVRFRRPGLRRARASRRGYGSASARVRVLRARR